MKVELKCALSKPRQGESCRGSILVEGPVSPNASYTCASCNAQSDKSVKFQKHQFEKDLNRGHQPESMNHIPNKTGLNSVNSREQEHAAERALELHGKK